jgi:hypothetical protein
LPARHHIGIAGTIKDNLARLLDGTDPGPASKQRACRQKGNKQYDDRFSAHKRRDYTTSQVETLKLVLTARHSLAPYARTGVVRAEGVSLALQRITLFIMKFLQIQVFITEIP